MITAWIDEKKLGDRLQDFRTDHLGAVQTFMGKSLRPFTWKHGEPRHVFGLDSFVCFLGAIEILVLTEIEKFYYENKKNLQYELNPYYEHPEILFGDTARHAIQKFNFCKFEIL